MKSTKKGLLFAALAVSLATLPGQFAQAQDVAAQPRRSNGTGYG